MCLWARSSAGGARAMAPREMRLQRAGLSKISGTLLGLLGRLKLVPRACWGFFGPLISTSAASQNHEGQLDTAAE